MVSLIHVFCILLIFFLSGCEGGGDDNLSVSPGIASDGSSGTGSAVFTVTWHDDSVIEDSENSLVMAQEESVPLSCEDVGVEKIICEAYEVKDGSSTFLTSGGPWDCSLHSETINAIDAGEDRTFVLLGVDNEENILYHGEVSGVTITAGQINDVGTVDAHPFFVSDLLNPVDGSVVDLDNFSLNWTPVETAYNYRIQVSEDIDFETIVIDETTTDIQYTPSGLLESTTYYWRVYARDIHANQSAVSTVWSFTVGPCTYSISPTSQSFGSGGGGGSINVTSLAGGCTWTATKGVNWISIISDSSGSGDGTVTYSVSANTSSNSRSATITVAGNLHTVTQEGVSCEYLISPPSSSFTSDGGTGFISVTSSASDCGWTATESVNWISIISDSSGSGSGTVTYTVSANKDTSPRTATITVAGKNHTVNQDGVFRN